MLLLISGTQLGDLELRDDLFDDFCLNPFHPRELEARLRHLFWRTGSGTAPELVEYGDAAQVYRQPQHVYTRQLLDAIPSGRLAAIGGGNMSTGGGSDRG